MYQIHIPVTSANDSNLETCISFIIGIKGSHALYTYSVCNYQKSSMQRSEVLTIWMAFIRDGSWYQLESVHVILPFQFRLQIELPGLYEI